MTNRRQKSLRIKYARVTTLRNVAFNTRNSKGVRTEALRELRPLERKLGLAYA